MAFESSAPREFPPHVVEDAGFLESLLALHAAIADAENPGLGSPFTQISHDVRALVRGRTRPAEGSGQTNSGRSL